MEVDIDAVSRSPAHCIEYAHLIQWQQERSGDEFDTDNEEHMRWVYDKALQRAEHFGIQVLACTSGSWKCLSFLIGSSVDATRVLHNVKNSLPSLIMGEFIGERH